MNEDIKYFRKEETKTRLVTFSRRVNLLKAESEFEKSRNSFVRVILGAMEARPEDWDRFCQINIGLIGEGFMGMISKGESLSKVKLDSITAILFRFLFELDLSIKERLNMELDNAQKFIFNNVSLFEDEAKEQIEYAIKSMPITIFKSIAQSDAIKSIKEFNGTFLRAEKLKEKWDKEIDEKSEKVNVLKDDINKYETAFNFVGLYQGFDELAVEKINERNRLILSIRLLGIGILIPIAIEIIVIYAHLNDLGTIKEALLYFSIPTISFVAISIYYFRVLLQNYNSTKSQLLQIELRKTLCRFIQHYSDYSKELKEKDSTSLEKFENIIFSGILSDSNKLPSTYDGLEQLSSFIRSFKP